MAFFTLWLSTTFVAFLLICILTIPTAHSYRILAYPDNAESHILAFAKLAAALTEANHSVDLLIPSNSRLLFPVDPRISIIRYPVRFERAFYQDAQGGVRIMGEALLKSTSSHLETVMNNFVVYQSHLEQDRAECEDLLQNSDLIDKLAANKYDLVVLDILDVACAPALPYKLGLPVVLFLPGVAFWAYRIPVLPSVAPDVHLPYSQQMSFWERTINLVSRGITEVMANYFASDDFYIRTYVPEKPVLPPKDILREALLWIYRHSDLLQYPMPQMPNVLTVGDLSVKEAGPLPTEYETLLNSTKGPVILFSMGTLFDHLPDQLVYRFCDAVRLLNKDILIIWKTRVSLPTHCLQQNIITKQWLPQNDLLGHPKVSLFITHCGLKSYAESAYHGKPLICFPVFADQAGNAANMQQRGLGLSMDIRAFMAVDLAANIDRILGSDSNRSSTFTANTQRMALLMRHAYPTSAQERIAFWIEHVIKFGGDHLRTSGYELNLAQFLMLDVLTVMFMIVLMVVVVCSYCCLRLCRLCKSRMISKGKPKRE